MENHGKSMVDLAKFNIFDTAIIRNQDFTHINGQFLIPFGLMDVVNSP